MIAGRVEDVQLVNLAANAIQLAVKVLDGRRVRVVKFAAQESRHQRRLAHARRTVSNNTNNKIAIRFNEQYAILGGAAFMQLNASAFHPAIARSAA